MPKWCFSKIILLKFTHFIFTKVSPWPPAQRVHTCLFLTKFSDPPPSHRHVVYECPLRETKISNMPTCWYSTFCFFFFLIQANYCFLLSWHVFSRTWLLVVWKENNFILIIIFVFEKKKNWMNQLFLKPKFCLISKQSSIC